MKEFLKYFFGQGTEVEFENFTLAHILPILILVGVVILIYLFKDKIKACKYEKNIRTILAFILIINEMSYFWRLVAVPELGANPIDHLPITICGWTIILSSYLLVTKSQNLFDVAYFWVFSGTIFALITPTVITYTGPTRFRYYQFWLEHSLGYVAIFYMIFIHGMRPNVKSMIKSYGCLIILAIIAIVANSILGPGANYLFLAKPESTPSILDILPSNYPLRLTIMGFAILLLFFISYLPWFFKDGKKFKFTFEDKNNQIEE